MINRTVDGRGRVNLGISFAGAVEIVDDTDPQRVIVMRAKSIPKREQWLYRNPKALASVRRGLLQARAGQFSKSPPDLSDSGI